MMHALSEIEATDFSRRGEDIAAFARILQISGS
jgi:hypothetical protein